MKSEWRVGYRMEGYSRQYCLFRLRDVSLSDNPGNREYDRNWYPNLEYAEKAAEERNKQEYGHLN